MLRALRVRDFRLLWAGSLISSLGSWLLVIAIPAHVLQVTGSLRYTGLTLAAEYLPPLLLGPAAGVVTDRWDRRRLMIVTSLFRAGAVAVMLAGIAPGRYWILYAALVAESGGGVLYSPAEQARTPTIVGTGPVLSSANSLNAFADGAVRFIGGPLGGILLAFCGVRWLICADVLSYLVCAATGFMTSRTDGENARRHRVISDLARDLLDGARVLRGEPVTRALLPVTVISLTANASLSAVLIPFGIRKLGGSEHTGFLLACLGVGFLLGAPVLRALMDRLQPRILLTASLTATAVMYYLLFSSSSLATALPAATAIGMSGSMSQVIPLTAMQRVIPGAALGRVSAAFLTGEAAATLTGAVTGPFLAQTVHLTGAAIASAVATLGAAALTYLTVPRLSHSAGPRTDDRAGASGHTGRVHVLTTLGLDSLAVVLRRAELADVPAIVDLLAADQLGATRDGVRTDADLQAYQRAFGEIDRDPAHVLVVAEAEGRIVGTMQLSYIPGLARRGALRAQIEAVRVHRDHRDRGLGHAMLTWAIGQARQHGCALVQLTTDKSRADAHRFYERLGFTASHEGMKLPL